MSINYTLLQRTGDIFSCLHAGDKFIVELNWIESRSVAALAGCSNRFIWPPPRLWCLRMSRGNCLCTNSRDLCHHLSYLFCISCAIRASFRSIPSRGRGRGSIMPLGEWRNVSGWTEEALRSSSNVISVFHRSWNSRSWTTTETPRNTKLHLTSSEPKLICIGPIHRHCSKIYLKIRLKTISLDKS